MKRKNNIFKKWIESWYYNGRKIGLTTKGPALKLLKTGLLKLHYW